MAAQVLGALIGAAFGVLIGYCNMRITKHSVKKKNGDGVGGVMATNLIRQVINIAALALVFLLRNVLPLPFVGTIIGTALGLSGGNVLFIWLLTRQMAREQAGGE